MSINNINLERIKKILSKEYFFDNFDNLANKYYKRYSNKKKICNFKTPCYFIDEGLLEENINSIKKDFYRYFEKDQLKIFYPVKINNNDFILTKMIKAGIGLEVASIDEYKLALSLKAEKILYYAPGKTDNDLHFFVQNCNLSHTLHVDSFSELNKLKKILLEKQKQINIGVRIFTNSFGDWQKYGINLDDLALFIKKANDSKYINFNGIHFHTSRNIDSHIYIKTLSEIGDYLGKIDKKYLENIKYIDFGGGFEKNNIEGSYFKGTQKSNLSNMLGNYTEEDGKEIITLKSYSLDNYVSDIYKTIKEKILPLFGGNINFYTEPGRIFVSNAMHILSKVVDVKDELNNTVIVNAGVNMIGRQRAEFEYFPVINLSSGKKLVNKRSMIYGNLCTTWDHWGYYCYTEKNLKENDILLFSNQGTLSYSLAQRFFINKLPGTFIYKSI